MNDVTQWVCGSLASMRGSIQLPPDQALLGAAPASSIVERVFPSERVGTPDILSLVEDDLLIVDAWSGTDGGARRTTSNALLQARLRVAELTAANRRKDEFLAVLGHELRNPLAAIHNVIHLLSHQTDDTPVRQKINSMIERQVRRMTQLVDELLDVSRITHGSLRLQRERIDLRDVVSNTIQTLESDIKQRNHRLTTVLPDTPVWLQADPGRLEQVFVNLLANASKYTDKDGELAVSVSMRGSQAIVRVRDSGIGITPEFLPHLFDLFRQADETAPRSQSGLGIGLALVRKLVESHGGSVIAESAGVGQGSEFTVYLPREI